MTRIINPGRMILSAPHDGLVGPLQVTWYCRFNNINCPLVKLLITLAQASSEDMILPTIQLLRIALITRLLLLIPLMVITSLIALITLIAMSGLMALES